MNRCNPPPFYDPKVEARRAEILREMEEHRDRLLMEMSSVDKDTLTKLRLIVNDYHNTMDKLTALYLEYMANMTVKVSECQRQVDKIIEDALQALVNVSIDTGGTSALYIVDEVGDTYALYIEGGRLKMRREVSQ